MKMKLIFLAVLSASVGYPAQAAAVYNVRDFGAVGDGKTKDTKAFQNALDACAVSGGGEVDVPVGHYLIGSIQMGNRTILKLVQGSVITGSGDTNDYPMLDIRWEGRWQPGRRALIYTANVAHTGIVGPGIIEGNAAMAAPQNPRGAVVLEPINCDDVRWEDFTVTQGGNWATHPTFCSNVQIKNITINGGRDGIDVDSCRDVSITGCHIDTGDDSISLKSGRGLDGARLGIPTANVLIKDCVLDCRRFACIGIGSETSGGIADVKIEHCQFTSRTYGIYIKTRIGRAGVIQNISADDIDVTGGGFLRVNLVNSGNLNTADDPVPGLIGYPEGRDFHFSNIRMNGTTLAEVKPVAPEKPLVGFSLKHVTGTCTHGITLENVKDAVVKDINVAGYQGALITETNSPSVKTF